jgi:6-phosphogluconolactonase
MTTGEAKADPVARALAGASEVDIPAAGARGLRRTLWLLDAAAAAKIS